MTGRQILISADAYARLSDIAFEMRDLTGVLPSFDEVIDSLLDNDAYRRLGV